MCGGKNLFGNMNSCLQYNIEDNDWKEISPMAEQRLYAKASLDEDGNLWVVGGTHENTVSLTTEVYLYEEKRWTRGYELPQSLRDTGIESHCIVR